MSDGTGAHASTLSLVLGARAGNAGAIDDLFARYRVRLRAWASGRVPAHARGHLETEDIVQDVLVRTFQRLDRLSPDRPGCFQAYTRRAVLNAIRDHLRRTRSTPDEEAVAREPGHEASPLEHVIGREALDRYEAALDRLGETDRELVVARIEMHAEYEEIAELLQKPSVDAARVAVKRALVRLAREMQRG